MRFIAGFIVIVSLMIGFTACQKEIDWGRPNSPQADSTTLIRMVLLDTTQVTGQDTLVIVLYYYDAQKRKTGENRIEVDNLAGTRDTYFFRYSFQGTDTLPWKVSEKFSFFSDSLVNYLGYSNGYIVKDSALRYNSGTPVAINLYEYKSIGSTRYWRRMTVIDPGTGMTLPLDSVVYTRTVITGNPMNGLDSAWIIGGPLPPTHYQTTSFQCTYDNKNGPLTRYSLRYLGYYDIFDNGITIDKGFNNLLSESYTQIVPPLPPDNYSYTHTYNSFNYPVITRMPGSGNKLLYFYTKL